MAKDAMKTLYDLFLKLPLRHRPQDTMGVTDRDYGSHEKLLCFDSTSDKSVGELVLGEHENSHCCEAAESVTGLTGKTMQKNNLAYTKAILKSLCATSLPHPMGYIRLNPMTGADTTPHTDNMRGVTVNLVNFHSRGNPYVDARIMVRCWPQFRTSVVRLHNDLFIPFDYAEVEDSLVMIGPGMGCTSHLPEDCGKCVGKYRGSATFFHYPASILEELEPFGTLNFAVIGLKQGLLQALPFLHPMDPASESFCSTTLAYQVKWSDALNYARMNPQLPSCKEEPPREMGGKANTWHQFYGWRYIHQFKGDPHTPRCHVFYRFVRESNSGGCLRTTHGKPNHVEKH